MRKSQTVNNVKKSQKKNAARKQAAKKNQNQNRPPRNPKMVSAPAAVATGQVGRAPRVTMGNGKCRVNHREMVDNVFSSFNYAVAGSYPLNPGMAKTFPWLSTMASSWEEYRFHKLRFRYYTRCGTGTTGSVLLIPDYDASDPLPSSEQVATTYRDVVEDAPWKDMECVLRAEDLNGPQNRRFVRSEGISGNQDIKQYDSGNLFLASTDATANGAWGKLWVEYDVEFFIPQINPGGPSLLAGGVLTAGGTLTPANPFGTVPILDAQDQYISMDNSSTLTFDLNGDWLVAGNLTGTGVADVPLVTFGGGITSLGSTISTVSGSGATVTWMARYRSNESNGLSTIHFDSTALATTITTGRLNVARVPSGSLG